MSRDTIVRRGVMACITAVVLLVTAPGRAGAGDRFTFHYDRQKLVFGVVDGYDIIRYGNLDLSTEIGAPQVPFELVRIALPPGADIAGVRIVRLDSEDLPGDIGLFPVQKPQILSRSTVSFTGADPGVYSSPSAYPADVVNVLHQGFESGFSTAALAVHPVQYFPTQKRIVFHSLIEIEIDYKPGSRRPFRHRSSGYSDRVHRSSLEKTVRNPARLERSASVEPPSPSPSQRDATVLLAEEHLYVVITNSEMASSFDLLVDRKTLHGLSATTVTTDWIAENYDGVDLQEQIRNFIRDAYENWGTVWVLLGGDTNVIPARMTYAMDCEMGGSNNQIPCDLYYADLDGDWNANGNGTYGEVADEIDMYPDVYVGRASFNDGYEASDWMMKLLDYEVPPPDTHALDMLFLADVLWQNPYTNSGEAKDYIDQTYVPDRFDPVEKLYAALGNENYVNVMAALNRGVNIVNHCGHAWWNSMQIGTGWLLPDDMYSLTNDRRCSVMFSIGCWPAAFDYDCIAEAFLANPDGGGVAFIGNSRYGWGSPGNPLYGYSDRFDQQFFRMLFEGNIVHVGQALAETKSVYVPFARQENVYRWCEYEVNLLGDPAMPVWTDEPQWMHVDHPFLLPVGPATCPITVTRSADGSPVDGALVCLRKGDEIYKRGFTGRDGRVIFDITSVNPAEEMWIGVTAPNLREGSGSVNFTTSGPCVQITRYATNGSVYGLVTPGDTVLMDVCFKNLGAEPAAAVNARISESSAHITLLDSTEAIGTISPGDSVFVVGAYSLAADSSLTNGEIVHMMSEIVDGANIWTDRISVTGALPELGCVEHTCLDDAFGDGDGFAEPGETVSLDLVIANRGFLAARDAAITLSCESPNIGIECPNLGCGDIAASDQRCVHTTLAIDAGCAEPSFPHVNIVIQTQDGYRFVDSVMVAVGELGFSDNMENGEGPWIHVGDPDLWHVSSRRAHGGSCSWYCGIETLFFYGNYMDNSLVAGPFPIGENSELSFWCWYDLPTYGSDGVYVDVSDGAGWTTLDFLGSGGALGRLPVGNDWMEYRYDLSRYPAGTPLMVRFRFVSDDESGLEDGVFIDDVRLGARAVGDATGIDLPPDVPALRNQLLQNIPNPFNPSTTIRFTLAERTSVKLEIFDVRGARVRVLMDDVRPAGSNRVSWDGRNDNGDPASSGVYFCRLRAGYFQQTRKMVLIR